MIELMMGLVVLGVLMAIALPSYTSYTQRSKVPAGLDGLSALATRMEQCFQDTGTYTGCAACGSSKPTPTNFSLSCTIPTGGATYSATATGSGPVSGYAYTIDSNGNRATTAHPKGTNTTCWTTRGTSCDS
jgi:type IV pilus assembly protein PilE